MFFCSDRALLSGCCISYSVYFWQGIHQLGSTYKSWTKHTAFLPRSTCQMWNSWQSMMLWNRGPTSHRKIMSSCCFQSKLWSFSCRLGIWAMLLMHIEASSQVHASILLISTVVSQAFPAPWLYVELEQSRRACRSKLSGFIHVASTAEGGPVLLFEICWICLFAVSCSIMSVITSNSRHITAFRGQQCCSFVSTPS